MDKRMEGRLLDSRSMNYINNTGLVHISYMMYQGWCGSLYRECVLHFKCTWRKRTQYREADFPLIRTCVDVVGAVLCRDTL